MRKRFWLSLCSCLLAVGVRAGVGWRCEGADSARASKAARATDGGDPVLSVLSHRFRAMLVTLLLHEVPPMPWRTDP